MIGGNPNYWNLYATKGHTHDDMYSKLGHNHIDIRPLYDYNGKTSYLDTPLGLSYFINTGDSNGLPLGNCTTLTVKANEYRQWQFCGDTVGNELFFRSGHSDNTTGTATGWSPWRRVGFNKNSSSEGWWNMGAVFVDTAGKSHLGNQIYFHNANKNDTSGYLGIDGNGWYLYTNKSLLPSTNDSFQIGSSSNRWSTIYLIYNPNVSSDRNLKENITYLKNNTLSDDVNITYNDMYDFVKHDLELARYNFKGDCKEAINFIAQDLLYNLDGTDNKVGQFIVPPIPVPTEEEKAEIISNLEDGQEYQDPTLNYDMGNYISVLAGALKVSINKIDDLTNRIETLEQTVNQLLDKVNSDL